MVSVSALADELQIPAVRSIAANAITSLRMLTSLYRILKNLAEKRTAIYWTLREVTASPKNPKNRAAPEERIQHQRARASYFF